MPTWEGLKKSLHKMPPPDIPCIEVPCMPDKIIDTFLMLKYGQEIKNKYKDDLEYCFYGFDPRVYRGPIIIYIARRKIEPIPYYIKQEKI